MIQLTESLIAVEVTKGSKSIFVSHWPKSNPELMYLTRKDNPVSVKLTHGVKYSLIGVTPLSEEQWKKIMYSKQIGQMTEPRWRDHQYGEFVLYGLKTSTESGLSLLESKGLDINKRYAIIKIEK